MTKAKRRRIRITVRPYAEAVAEIMAVCESIEKGLAVEPRDTELNFTDASNLLSALSKKRLELLMFLHKAGPLTIRQLAKDLHRDYSVVHGDVKTLLDLGLLAINDDKKIYVPWDELAIELPLADLKSAG